MPGHEGMILKGLKYKELTDVAIQPEKSDTIIRQASRLKRLACAWLQAFAVAVEYLAEAIDTVIDTGPAQATPHLRLVAGDDGFAG